MAFGSPSTTGIGALFFFDVRTLPDILILLDALTLPAILILLDMEALTIFLTLLDVEALTIFLTPLDIEALVVLILFDVRIRTFAWQGGWRRVGVRRPPDVGIAED